MDDMYLSDLFLDILGMEPTDEKAVQAAIACNEEYKKHNASRIQLRNFWDCARDYPDLEDLDLPLVKKAAKAYQR